ncbi:MAG: hypothetical protein RLZZ426_462 [Actinomycetota bacterium]|jgi:hypothetical protein
MLTEIIYQDIALRLLTDLVGMLVLVGVLFYRNYRRIDFVAVFMACNIGLFSVLTVLASSEISAAIGFGLFGVLSIIRLRSSEYDNIHIAYFFISIAIALVTSLETHPLALSVGFVTLLVGVMAIFDTGSLRQQTFETELILDQLFVDQDILKNHLEETLNCKVIAMQVNAINYLNETTRVTLSYRVNKSKV